MISTRFGPEKGDFRLLKSEVSKRGWRAEGVGTRKSCLCQIFRHRFRIFFPIPPLGEGRHNSEEHLGPCQAAPFLETSHKIRSESLGEGEWGRKSAGVSQSVRETGKDESQSVPSPEKLFKARDLELPIFEGSLPSCSPHSAEYTRTSVHPYIPVAKIRSREACSEGVGTGGVGPAEVALGVLSTRCIRREF